MSDFIQEIDVSQSIEEGESRQPTVHETFTSKNFKLAVAHEEMNSRRRNTMEDVHRVLPILHEKLPDFSYLGVYDGHGGRQIVDYLETGLETIVAEEFLFEDDASPLERITRAFLRTDLNSKVLNITTSGATAVVAMLSTDAEGNRRIISANVGDSRAVLVKKESNNDETSYVATRLTYDHRAEDKAEQRRVTEAGGFVIRNRVLGILAVSRSFGDHGMKDYVTAEPFVTIVDLDKTVEYPFLILACDGVWDVFSDQEAADLILERFLVEGPFVGAAELLVESAIERGSSDNITAIIAFL